MCLACPFHLGPHLVHRFDRPPLYGGVAVAVLSFFLAGGDKRSYLRLYTRPLEGLTLRDVYSSCQRHLNPSGRHSRACARISGRVHARDVTTPWYYVGGAAEQELSPSECRVTYIWSADSQHYLCTGE